jgi:5-methylcytosine-specific restriction endonuclease McrA
MARRPARSNTLRVCPVCGTRFYIENRQHTYCTAFCRAQARGARGIPTFRKRPDPLGKLGRRSGNWRRLCAIVLAPDMPICGICGYPIDKSLPRGPVNPHPFSATVDHIQDRIDRPDLAEELHNLQPAHRICNLRKAALHGGRRRRARARFESQRPRVGG